MTGETILLVTKTQTGEDKFHEPVYSEGSETVENVLVGSPSTDEINTEISLYGKKLVFILGIPKGDTHNWKDAVVYIRGDKYKTYGEPLTQTPQNVPGPWNTQVKVAMYEQGTV